MSLVRPLVGDLTYPTYVLIKRLLPMSRISFFCPRTLIGSFIQLCSVNLKKSSDDTTQPLPPQCQSISTIQQQCYSFEQSVSLVQQQCYSSNQSISLMQQQTTNVINSTQYIQQSMQIIQQYQSFDNNIAQSIIIIQPMPII